MSLATAEKTSRSPETSIVHIALDARKVFDGGIGTYIRNLIVGLISLRSTEGVPLELSLFVTPEVYRSKEWQAFAVHKEVQTIIVGCAPYSLSEYLLFSRRVSWTGIDIFHSPHYTLPYGIPVPAIVTVHDVIHLSHPQRWYYPIVAKRMIASALKRAKKVITVSKTSKAAVQAYFPRYETPEVIPNAVDFSYLESDEEVKHDRRIEEEPYILVVSSTDKPHKGVDDLLQAYDQFARFREGAGDSVPALYVCGKGARPRNYQGAGSVCFLGIQSHKSLQELYRHARLLCVPSVVEGSCMPALEAHMSGVPVVSRPVPAVVELLDEHYDTVARDFSCEALSEALLRAYDALPNRAAAESVQQRTRMQHSPSSIARHTMHVYQAALGRNL